MAIFDKTQPFGTVCGFHPASFVQGESYFNAEEQEINPETGELVVDAPVAKKKVTKAEVTATDDLI
jgi:hypothetical protein